MPAFRTWASLMAVLLPAPLHAAVSGYYQFPTIHGDRIVFAAEGDLWSAPVAGGLASRLTTHVGSEAFPKFSPDGRWLAFSGQYQGNVDVYVMPASGGEPRRLTFHPGDDEVVAWRPDSRTIVFRSRRLSPNGDYQLFDVPIDGGHPQLVPIGIASLASFAPDGRTVVFNRFSLEFRTWKRYLGGWAQDVWIGDLAAGTFRKITDWDGADAFPMWHDGVVYFASDRTGRMNLYSCTPDGGNVRALTTHDEYDVRWPSMNAGRIVYMHGGDLYILEVSSSATRKIEIELPTDRLDIRPRVENASETLESYDLSEDGERIVLSSRGENWVRPTHPGRIIQLHQTPGVRERAGVFSPDGKTIAFITDETGEQELAVCDAAGAAPHRVLTSRGKGWLFMPTWSPDGKWLAFGDLTQALFITRVESGETAQVDASDVWEITEYAFSPDSKWLAYVKEQRNGTSAIFLWNVENRQPQRVTSGFSRDHSPAWDPDGKFLYFLSERRVNPVLDSVDFEFITTRMTVPCLMILAREGKSPLLPRELLDDEADDESDAEDEADDESDEAEDDAADDKEIEPIVIDLDGLELRTVPLPVPPGNYFSLRAAEKQVLFMSGPVEGLLDQPWPEDDDSPKYQLHQFDFEEREFKTLIESLRDYDLSDDHSRIAHRVDDEILICDLDSVADLAAEDYKEKASPSELPLLVDPAQEWAQIFHEAWRLQRDFYWAENMAGVNWPAMRDLYARLLPRIGTRQELNDLIGQLIGELGTSHTYVWGGDARHAGWVGVGLLGADLTPDPAANAMRFARVLRPEPWETEIDAPLTASHAHVQDGEYLFEINHRAIRATDNLFERLANLAEQQVLLKVGPNADQTGAREIQIETLDSDETLRYYDWRRRNREYVAQKSGGRIGYMHLPDMGGDGLVSFIRGFYPQTESEALLIDARYNGGGFVSQLMIARLARTVIAYDQPRRGKTSTYPARVHVGPKVVLVNQLSGSDGDIFPAAFQMVGLGPVIGMRTWGGVIGIRGDKEFIDGGLSTQPEFAWWDTRRGWDLENRGVEPDIVLDNLPQDWVAGRDPQLDRGIDELLKRLAENPVQRPVPPPPPDKSRVPVGGTRP